MEKTVRRKYTDEFKEGAVKLVTDQGYKTTGFGSAQSSVSRLLILDLPSM